MRRGLTAAIVVVVAFLAGCTDSGDNDADAESKAPLSGAVCSSAASSSQVDLPTGFPTEFPLPEGMIVTSAEDRGDAGILVTGVTGTPFDEVLSGLQDDLPANGFTLTEGESEPHDAESNWTSADYEGRWAIRENPACAGDTAVQVLARATG